MAKHALLHVEPIRARFVLPKGAKIVGYLPKRDGSEDFDYPIVKEKRLVIEKEPVMQGGEQVWKLNPRGERVTPRFRNVKRWVEKEWVPRYGSQGDIDRNFNFRPDPTEQKRLEQKQKLDEFRRQFEQAAVDEGVDARDLMRAIVRQSKEEEKQSVVGANDYPRQAGPGRWKLSDGSVVRGKKVDALKAEAALSDEPLPAA